MDRRVDDRNVEDRIATWLDDVEVKAQGFDDEADRDARLAVSWERDKCSQVAHAAERINQIMDAAIADCRDVLTTIKQDAAA